MIVKFLRAAAAFAALSLSLTAFAQVTLLDLSDGNAPLDVNPQGTWGPGLQDTEFQRFWQRSNDIDSGITFGLDPALNISGLDLLALTARINGNHDGLTLTVTLIDSLDFTASAIFDLAAFDNEFFTTQNAAWTPSDFLFNPAAIRGVHFSGQIPGGVDTLNFDAQRLEAVRLSSVPEPSTYAAAGAGGLLLLAAFRRRRRQA